MPTVGLSLACPEREGTITLADDVRQHEIVECADCRSELGSQACSLRSRTSAVPVAHGIEAYPGVRPDSDSVVVRGLRTTERNVELLPGAFHRGSAQHAAAGSRSSSRLRNLSRFADQWPTAGVRVATSHASGLPSVRPLWWGERNITQCLPGSRLPRRASAPHVHGFRQGCARGERSVASRWRLASPIAGACRRSRVLGRHLRTHRGC